MVIIGNPNEKNKNGWFEGHHHLEKFSTVERAFTIQEYKPKTSCANYSRN